MNAMLTAVRSVPQTSQASTDQSEHPKAESGCGWVARLIEAHGKGIARVLWRILGREQDVMDAYQDCFCKLASLPQRPDLRSAKAYVYRTAANIAIEMIRSRTRRKGHWGNIIAGRQPVTEDSSEVAHDATAHHDKILELRRRIAELPPHLRNVVVLRDLSLLSYDEIGRMLGIDPATARVYRRHAVVKLAESLEDLR